MSREERRRLAYNALYGVAEAHRENQAAHYDANDPETILDDLDYIERLERVVETARQYAGGGRRMPLVDALAALGSGGEWRWGLTELS